MEETLPSREECQAASEVLRLAVRDCLALGYKHEEIRLVLEGIRQVFRETGGNNDTDEAVCVVLDELAGWCGPDQKLKGTRT